MSRRCVLAALAVVTITSLLAGCGGTGTPSGDRGSLGVGVRFPPRAAEDARRVPVNANSVRISILPSGGGAPLVPAVVLNNPPEGGVVSTTIGGIPAGPVTVEAVAYPQTGAVGPALARARANAVIVGGETVQVRLTLVEVVARVVAKPPELHVLVGGRGQILADAIDETGAIIIGAPLEYHSENRAIATVDPTGKVTGKALGQTKVTVRHAASGKQAEVLVKVVESLAGLLLGRYDGEVTGDHRGSLRFYVQSGNALVGGVTLTDCRTFEIQGAVTDAGNVTWSGTGCGVGYEGLGVVEKEEAASARRTGKLVGGGVWESSDGGSGEWTAEWTGPQTGVISG